MKFLNVKLGFLLLIVVPVSLGLVDPFGSTNAVAAPGGNSAPTISGNPASSAQVGKSYYFKPRATDSNGDNLTFSIRNKPRWARFDKSSGKLSGKPTSGDIGKNSNIVISVSDGRKGRSLPAFSIQVNKGSSQSNSAPTISGSPASSVQVAKSYYFKPNAKDSNNDKLTFSIRNKPSWSRFDKASGKLTGKPARSHIGATNNIVISVSDGKKSQSLKSFSIRVSKGGNQSNAAPTISGNPATSAKVGVRYYFKPAAKDANGDKLAFSIRNKPTWASFSKSTGKLDGKPLKSDIGKTSNIIIAVSDGKNSRALKSFSIRVGGGTSGNGPTISGNPASSVMEGTRYYFRPTATDPNGDKLTFSVTNKPPWATFRKYSGKILGTPTRSDWGIYDKISITVTDGRSSKSLPPFSISVAKKNADNAPSISGQPATSINVRNKYVFKPQAADADGDKLIFSIENKPDWANFNSTSGKLSGSPSSSDVGEHGDILISVSDGTSFTSLASFSINVTQLGLGSVTLSWTAPTLNTDGSPLRDLTGYKVYYGVSRGSYPNEVMIDNPGLTTYVVENLAENTYYFVATSINSSGIESDYSNVAVRRASRSQ